MRRDPLPSTGAFPDVRVIRSRVGAVIPVVALLLLLLWWWRWRRLLGDRGGRNVAALDKHGARRNADHDRRGTPTGPQPPQPGPQPAPQPGPHPPQPAPHPGPQPGPQPARQPQAGPQTGAPTTTPTRTREPPANDGSLAATAASNTTTPTAACSTFMLHIMPRNATRCTARNDLLQHSQMARGCDSTGRAPAPQQSRPPVGRATRFTMCAREGAKPQVKIDIFNHVMPARYLELYEAALEGRRSRETHVEPAAAVGCRGARGDAARAVPGRAAGADPLAPAAGGARRAGPRARARPRRERRNGGDVPAVARPISGIRGVAADEQRAGRGCGDGPRDRRARRARDPDLHQRRRAAARRARVLSGVRARGEASRRADLDASGAAGVVRRLPHRAEIEVRDLAGPRLAVRDERCDGAHRVLGPFRATAGDAPHHPSLRRDDPVLRGACRNAVGTARLALRRRRLRRGAEAPRETADRILPDVLRRHRPWRRVGTARVWARILRRRPRRVRERLPVRSGGWADVHPRRHPLDRGPPSRRRRQAQDLLRQCHASPQVQTARPGGKP